MLVTITYGNENDLTADLRRLTMLVSYCLEIVQLNTTRIGMQCQMSFINMNIYAFELSFFFAASRWGLS